MYKPTVYISCGILRKVPPKRHHKRQKAKTRRLRHHLRKHHNFPRRWRTSNSRSKTLPPPNQTDSLQPSDHGYLNDKKVYHVTRKADKAIHFLTEPLEVGETVVQKIDWDRRFDHMQQHSGQHLITAVIDRQLGYPTVSWWLGEEVSYIELGEMIIYRWHHMKFLFSHSFDNHGANTESRR